MFLLTNMAAVTETFRLISLGDSSLLLRGTVTFHSTSGYYNIISMQSLLLHGFLKFSNICCKHIIAFMDKSNNFTLRFMITHQLTPLATNSYWHSIFCMTCYWSFRLVALPRQFMNFIIPIQSVCLSGKLCVHITLQSD